MTAPIEEEATASAQATAGGQAAGIWQRTLAELRLGMDRPTFDLHLSGSWPLAWDAGTNAWTIGVHQPDAVDWLQHRLAKRIRRALARHTAGLPAPQVTFVVASPPEDDDPRPVWLRRLGAANGAEPGPDLTVATPMRDGGVPHSSSGPERATTPMRGAGGARGPAGSPPGVQQALDLHDYYIKVSTSLLDFLCELRGPRLSVWSCLALNADRYDVSAPGLARIVRETGLSRRLVRRTLLELCGPELALLERLPGCRGRPDRYRLRGLATFGPDLPRPLAPAGGGDPRRASASSMDERHAVHGARRCTLAHPSGGARPDHYVRVKVLFRQRALALLRGAGLSVWWCLALRVDRDGISEPTVEQICEDTGYSRRQVLEALARLCSPEVPLLAKLPRGGRQPHQYRLLGYAWFGDRPAPALFEEEVPPD
jgi:hypothetical protein